MRGALLSTFCNSCSRVFYKKALNLSRVNPLSLYVFALFGVTGGVAVSLVYMFGGMVSLDALVVDRYYIGLIIVAVLLAVTFRPMNVQIYQEEKLAAVLPYTNLNKIFSLLLSFFLFRDVSVIALLIALGAVFVIIGFSIDIKHISFPKNFKKLFLAQSMISIRFIIMSWCVLQISDKVFYIYDMLIYTTVLFGIILYLKKQQEITHGGDKTFYMNRLGASAMGAIGTIIALYLISELGSTIVILLGFLELALVMIFGYFYLKETPTKKDLLLTGIVTVLVGIGFYLR